VKLYAILATKFNSDIYATASEATAWVNERSVEASLRFCKFFVLYLSNLDISRFLLKFPCTNKRN